MVSVMNKMGYSAAAVGNHDFDFGVEVLRQRSGQANFPFLCANLREKTSGKIPDYVQPFTLQEVNGIRVGLIGLTTHETAVDTNPSNVANLEFLPYEESLRQVVPQVKARGAQLIVVVGHLCTGEMRSLAPIASELGIPILCAGHCHEQIVEQVEDVTIVQAGSFMSSYIRFSLLFDISENRLEMFDARLLTNAIGGGDPVIQEAIQSWHDRADPTLWEVIGYAGQKIDAGSPEMAHLLTIPWLEALPGAQIAFFSPRYVQSLPQGDITPGSILGMIPTDNELVMMQITGAQIIDIIETHRPGMGGLVEKEGKFYLDVGHPLDSRTRYMC
jgi:2',3'-cyclic-nucleotide 2'-phosphodiesterase/3'-nucleotidase